MDLDSTAANNCSCGLLSQLLPTSSSPPASKTQDLRLLGATTLVQRSSALTLSGRIEQAVYTQ